MKHDIIKTDNYLLIGSNDDLKRGWFYCVRMKSIFQDEGEGVYCCIGDIRIAAHLPLNGAEYLEGVDLLPPLEDDEFEKLAKDFYASSTSFEEGTHLLNFGFIEGYNKAKQKYKWTDEDLIKAKDYGNGIGEHKDLSWEQFIKSLQQPKYPIGFECEMWYNEFAGKRSIKTTTNSQGQTVLVGKYIYE
jgi:hypothetical protein